MKDKRCRWCKHYSPDERYEGKIGICRAEWRIKLGVDNAVMVADSCNEFEEGEQYWLCGEKVKE